MKRYYRQVIPTGLLILLALSVTAQAYQLSSHKDRLFKYPQILDSKLNGDFLHVDYNKQRDLRDRDKVDEREVFGEYVSHYPRRSQKDLAFEQDGRAFRYIRAGKVNRNVRAIVIFIHGRNGNRHLGANDVSFGGNFNRIKNLMARNKGLYISTDISDFKEQGKNDVKALIAAYRQEMPKASIFVACGSMGGAICWRLARDPQVSGLLGGLIFLGSPTDAGFLNSPVVKNKSRHIPVYFGYGSLDRVYDWKKQFLFFDRIRKKAPGYPAKFVLFETGTHGTPIRMTDWRETINWMLTHKAGLN
ncbi:MAG: alpha/beta hydrolase [Stappiaceae bacterium]